jgi:hypothetical protein
MSFITTIGVKTRALAIGLLVAAFLAAGLGAGRADAMTPAQTTEDGVVNLLGGFAPGSAAGSIDDFWARTLPTWGFNSYTTPTIKYYGNGAGGYYTGGCGSTGDYAGENGLYCIRDNTIYLDADGQQGLLNRLGDHAAGGFLAHEWAHRAQAVIGTLTDGFHDYHQEYNADCMAGLYTRYGYDTGRLDGTDFGEFRNWLSGQPTSVSHGTGANRASWFEYGYTQYTKGACDQVFNLTESGGEGSRTAKMATAESLRPPAHSAPDLTPRRTDALPPGAPSVQHHDASRPAVV